MSRQIQSDARLSPYLPVRSNKDAVSGRGAVAAHVLKRTESHLWL